jgi:hypothetical protein
MDELLRGRQSALVASHRSWIEGRLCEDLPALAVALADHPPGAPSGTSRLDPPAGSVFDTHPSDAIRIANARREQVAGLFKLEGHSADLVPRLAELSRQATVTHYKVEEGFFVAPQQLLPLAAFLGRQGDIEAERKAAERYFGPGFSFLSPLAAGVPEVGGMDLASCLDVIREAPCAVQGLAPSASENANAERLTPLRYLLQGRLQACLCLLESTEARQRLENPDAVAAELRRMLGLLNALERQLPLVTTLAMSVRQAAQVISRPSEGTQVEEQFMQLMGVLHGHSEQLITQAEGVPYPFEVSGGPSSLASYLVKDPPSVGGPMYELVRAQDLLSRVSGLYMRALGRIAWNAELVERAALDLDGNASGGQAASLLHRAAPSP